MKFAPPAKCTCYVVFLIEAPPHRLGLAYAGSFNEDVIETLTPVIEDQNSSFEVVCLGALSSALIAVGTCHGNLTETFLTLMLERDASELTSTSARFLALALALLYLGKQEKVMTTLEALKVVPKPFGTFASTLLDICAYAGQSIEYQL